MAKAQTAAAQVTDQPPDPPPVVAGAEPKVEIAGEIAPAPKPQAFAGRDNMRDDIRQAPEGLIRKRKGDVDKFGIPDDVLARFAAAGWSLEWKRHTVMGQEDRAYQTALGENAWESVTTSEIAGYMPEGSTGAILRDGLQLMKRPSYLTDEARQEDTAAARGMIRAKEEQLGQSPQGTIRSSLNGPMPMFVGPSSACCINSSQENGYTEK